jgi:DNA-binding NarL/FixJ family response regulator
MSGSVAQEGPIGGPRVVLVDADRRIQQSLADVLRVTGGVNVVACAGDVRDALEAIAAHEPDVVVIDPRLPDIQAGSALVSSIRLGWPGTRLVLMGWNDGPEAQDVVGHASPALDALLSGGEEPLAYISKSAPANEFVAAVVNACCEIDLTKAAMSPAGGRQDH